MTNRAVGGALCVSVALAGPLTPRGLCAQSPESTVSIRIGPTFEGHTDLLATPFREHGHGLAVGLEYRRGRFWIDASGGSAATSSKLQATDLGTEDVWSGTFETGYLARTRRVGRTTLGLGGSLAALGFVRRHHYGPAAAREFFADLIAPLSLVGEVGRRVGSATDTNDRIEVGVVGVLFRSPFSGTKEFPSASLFAPWELVVVRNRLAIAHAVSPRLRLSLAHGLTVYSTNRYRPVRMVHQEVTVEVGVALGGGTP